MKIQSVNIIGWYGVFAIFIAYMLVNFGLLTITNQWYLLLNLTGALAILVETWAKRDYQPAVLNILWALVALVALIRIM